MDITFQKSDEVSGLLTIKLEKADYQNQVDKSLRTYRQKAQMKGFRPGMVPMGLVKKMYGKAIVSEEVNKVLNDKINEYFKENNLKTLGEPLTDEEKQKPIDFDTMETFEFFFDIALSPEFDVTVSKDDKVDYYTIEVSDKMVDDQVNMYKSRNGKHENVDSYEANDIIKGVLTELDEKGTAKEAGIVVEEAVVMPSYFKNEDQKKLFDGAKVDSTIVFNPATAYEGSKTELASLLKYDKEKVDEVKSDFSLVIKEITRYMPGDLTQEIFDEVYGKDAVKNEEEFRAKIKEDLAKQLVGHSDFKFFLDARKALEDKVGKLKFPDELLKRFMKLNNPDKDEKFVDDNYDGSIKALEWQLIREKLVEANQIKVENEDVQNMARQAAREQFAQYGMMQIPDDLLNHYVEEMLKKRETVNDLVDRIIENKLVAIFKAQMTLENKTISMDEFNKLLEKK
jgi:trigger factor